MTVNKQIFISDKLGLDADEATVSAAQHPLHGVIKRLIRSNAFQIFSNRPIRDFWGESDPRSPFEEELTIGQLGRLNIDPFIQKRSFTERKSKALMDAIERAIASCSEVRVGSTKDQDVKLLGSPNAPLSKKDVFGLSNSSLSSEELLLLDDKLKKTAGMVERLHPLVVSPITSLFVYGYSNGALLPHVASLITASVSVETLEVLALTTYLLSEDVASLLGRSVSEILSIAETGLSELRTSFAADMITGLTFTLLKGATFVSIDKLAALSSKECVFEPGGRQLCLSLFCKSAGLSIVRDAFRDGIVFKGTNSRFEDSLFSIKKSLPKTKNDLSSLLDEVFPLASKHDQLKAIAEIALFNDSLELWLPLPDTSRKEIETGNSKAIVRHKGSKPRTLKTR